MGWDSLTDQYPKELRIVGLHPLGLWPWKWHMLWQWSLPQNVHQRDTIVFCLYTCVLHHSSMKFVSEVYQRCTESLHLSCSVFFTLYHTQPNLLVLVYILMSISLPKLKSGHYLIWKHVCLIRLNGHTSFSIIFLVLTCWKDIETIGVCSYLHFFIIVIIYGYMDIV